MPDPKFFKTQTPMSIEEAVLLAEASLITGDDKAMLTSVAAHDDECLAHAVIYCADAAFLDVLAGREFGLCLVPAKLSDSAVALDLCGPLAVAASPRLGFARIADRLYQSVEITEVMARPDMPGDADIDETAVIDKSAKLGAGLQLGAHVSIGPGVSLGDGCSVNSGVSISHAEIGNNVLILGGARIGQAGFGFEESANGLVRVPQLGRVLIKDDVEIGANSTIDRGALGDTIIGQGTKIDNLVQIGHNTRIGKYCVFAAQTGISGSCIIGDGVFMGGQVGLKDHLTIGDGAQIAAGSGLMRDVPPGEKWGGSPARPVRDWLREISAVTRLARKKNG